MIILLDQSRALAVRDRLSEEPVKGFGEKKNQLCRSIGSEFGFVTDCVSPYFRVGEIIVSSILEFKHSFMQGSS